jgi:8-oxo-dGTP pyrophosphatase MutT (NUDIX family)
MQQEHQLPSNYRVSLKALIRDAEGRILLIKEGRDEWGLPGGGIDHGETIDEGLRREIREEIGADIATYNPVPIMIRPFHVADRNRYALWLIYEVTLAGKPQLTPETLELAYKDQAVLADPKVDPIERPAIERLFELIKP